MKRLSLFTVWLLAGLGCLRAEVSIFLNNCVVQRGDTIEIGLYMSDATTVTAFQADVLLPQGTCLLEARLSPKETSHSLLTKERGTGTVRIGCWSPSNAPFSAESERIASLTVLFPNSMPSGMCTFEIRSTCVVFPNGGKLALAPTTSTVWVNEAAEWHDLSQLFTEHPTSQAFYIQNKTSSRFLTLNATTHKATIEDTCDDDNSQFFLEPAFDAGVDCYYLRTAQGYYLTMTQSASTVRISVTEEPSVSSAVRFILTGDRIYTILHSNGDQQLCASSSVAGSMVSMKASSTNSKWELLLADAVWDGKALQHMAQNATSCIDLTKGYADLALRMAVHRAKRAAEGEETKVLSMLAEQLKAAVTDARTAQADGDTTVATAPWGIPEAVPATDYLVSVTDKEGNRHFLSEEEGQPVLSDEMTVCNMPIQEIFYNPYTDRYAICLESNGEGEEVFLSFNPEDGTVDKAPRFYGELLRVWQVQTVTEALTDDVERAGACGSKAKWRFEPDTRTLFITGGERTAYYTSADNTPWSKYRYFIEHVVLAGDFHMLGSYLLAGCTHLTRLTLTVDTPPSLGTNALEGVPEELELFVFNPDAYTGFVPVSKVSCIAKLKDSYIYNGQIQKPQVECDFETTVITSDMQTTTGTYQSTVTLKVYIEGTGYVLTLPLVYTIEPATLIATTRTYNRNYGYRNPSPMVVIEGLVGSDKEDNVVAERPVASCAADKKSPVGDYPIILSGGVLKNTNYTLVYLPSVLTVEPAPLMAYVQDVTRMEGEPNPPFTCTYTGFVNGEDESVMTKQPILSTDADEHSAPGLYDINANGGEAPNYNLRYVTGILTVLPSTAVKTPKFPDEPSLIYDLQSRCVGTDGEMLPPGLYIVGGRKYLVR